MTIPPAEAKSGQWRSVAEDPETLDQKPQPHGTYTKARNYRFVLSSEKGVDNKLLYVFDDNGEFGYFAWNDSDAWTPRDKPITVSWPTTGAENELGVKQGTTLTLHPRLVLLPLSKKTPYYYPVPSDDEVLRASQSIRYDKMDRRFVWKQEHAEGKEPLKFVHVHDSEHGQKAPSREDRFDYIFGSSHLGNFAFPFYGYKAVPLDVFAGFPSSDRPADPDPHRPGLAPPGTRPRSYTKNAGQIFGGTLIFSFPEPGSKDYGRWQDRQEQPRLPLGIRADQIKVKREDEHSIMISTVAERVDSWSLTVGLSAGVKKAWSLGGEGAYKETLQKQTENESRYVVARKVKKDFAYIIVEEAMELHAQYLRIIYGTLGRVLAGKDPEWQSFVDEFGTHYAHAITMGSLQVSETQLSLQAESTASEKKLDLKRTASGMLGGVGGKADIDFSKEWKEKHGVKVETGDVKSLSLGDANDSVPIFYDLRPTSELMSPLFFPYDPLTEWKRVAPFVWSNLRKSYEDFLKNKGLLDQPMASELNVDFRPRILSVSITEISVEGGPRDKENCEFGGKFTLTPIIGIGYNPAGQPATMQIEDHFYDKGKNLIGYKKPGILGGWDPAQNTQAASCTLVAKPRDISTKDCFKLSGEVHVLAGAWYPEQKLSFAENLSWRSQVDAVLSVENVFFVKIKFKWDNKPLMQIGE
jgi:hypothetical protein